MVDGSRHIDIFPEQQAALFEFLSGQAWIEPFYLAGGTCLALHSGVKYYICSEVRPPLSPYKGGFFVPPGQKTYP